MKSGSSPTHERAAVLAFDKQAAAARLDTEQSATERKPPEKSTATSLLLRVLYWIYERRLLDQLKQKPMPRHIGIILDGNRRYARKRGLSDPCEIYQCGAAAETAMEQFLGLAAVHLAHLRTLTRYESSQS